MALCVALAVAASRVHAEPACAVQAIDPSWADCAAEFSAGAASAGVVFGEPLKFDDGDLGTQTASIDFTTPAAPSNGSSRASTQPSSTLAAIPEPHTNLLMLAGLAAIGFMATRQRRP
jgi:hypothetical protein